MAKKQNKNLWLLVVGIVIVGIFLGPKLGLFSVMPETITVNSDGFENIEEIYESYKEDYTICVGENTEEYYNLITDDIDGPSKKFLFLTDDCSASLFGAMSQFDYMFLEFTTSVVDFCPTWYLNSSSDLLDGVDQDLWTTDYIKQGAIDVLVVTDSQSRESEEMYGFADGYYWCEQTDLLGYASSLELLNAHFEEDTNGGTTEDKWYNDCLFNYGEEDKCFSILFGLFALGGILLLMMFMRK